MTGRDRAVIIVVVTVAILAAVWVLAVSPERQQASQLSTQVAAARTQLVSAEGKASSARAAQSQYAAAYASVVNLGKAVPPNQEVPALIEQLARASNTKNVEFSSITTNSAGTSGSATASGASSVATAGLTHLPFSFVFEGSYFDLEHLFNQLTSFATLTASGDLQVSGRLLTIQSVRLAPAGGSSEAAKSGGKLTGSITATAYVLPASQGLTGATGAPSPAGAGTSPAASTGGSSPTSPAIVKVNP
jgi:Tfp pilus assembly protein PilO